MTREEAIKVLNTYDVNFYEYRAEEIVDAIDMAIEALQTKTDGDLISRRDAIEAIESNSYGMGSRASIKAIKALPSAEPVHGEWAERTERFIGKKLDEVRAELITMIGGDDE